MTRRITITEARTHFFALLYDVERGEEIEITRRGVTVARLMPARPRTHPMALKNKYAGLVTSNATDEELYSTGERWNAQ